jgi:hypothetical protein
MRTKAEQKAHLEKIAKEASEKATKHGLAINKALITTGQSVSGVTRRAGVYARDLVKVSLTDQREQA